MRSGAPARAASRTERVQIGLACSLVGVGDVSKRILLGRKLRSSQLGETLLPKRIALPVFASDALSSVAYAPDEVFIMLSLAGASAYMYSFWIGIAVALVLAAVVTSYRQTVRRLPQWRRRLRGRDRQPRPQRGDHRRQRAAVRLRAHGRRVDLCGCAVRRRGVPVALRAPGHGGDRNGRRAGGHEPARDPGVRDVLRRPDLRIHGRDSRHVRGGPVPPPGRRPAAGRERRVRHRARPRLRRFADDLRPAVPARARVLVGLRGSDRCRGDLQRRPGLPQAEEQERRHHAAPARRALDHDDAQHPGAGQADGAEVRRPARPRTAGGRCPATTTSTP